MVSHTQPPSDRQTNGRSGAGNGRAETAPGTPRKDGGVVKEKAVQDPGLKDYVGLVTGVADTAAHAYDSV